VAAQRGGDAGNLSAVQLVSAAFRDEVDPIDHINL